ncbi:MULTISPECIES: hypothetical protein [Myxococcus]|jgi:hypothetical protein|uniref:hypothetical protein n=1 Tax=Myxococcus TaxID=32 RepID=UPI001CBF972E|nr:MULTISPECIES: hypothetical protein [Myxococcus]MBZ4396263.1 hypothetical protein [Myxococcus sp. AS-1-15]MBZ4413110.1 hypothetical protein [Myxococcus sp. XM-1-1-1]MCK8498772.1 hypothetical protein [Myxococcus fulvus]BDT37773.1 hypothetical protein MFMH1_74420 [Myxococcus sp. MH1]
MWTAFQRPAAALSILLCLVFSTGCDSGPEKLREADVKYQALVDQGVRPTDPAWDEVVAALEAVPKDSRSRPEADKRLAAIRGLRGKLPPRPLATPGATGPGTDDSDAKRAACEALAKKLGVADDAAREPLQAALTQCQKELVRIESHSHPPGEHGHEHGHEAPATK